MEERGKPMKNFPDNDEHGSAANRPFDIVCQQPQVTSQDSANRTGYTQEAKPIETSRKAVDEQHIELVRKVDELIRQHELARLQNGNTNEYEECRGQVNFGQPTGPVKQWNRSWNRRKSATEMETVTCFNCRRKGHFRSSCKLLTAKERRRFSQRRGDAPLNDQVTQ